MFFFIVFSRIAICVFAPECERHLLTVHDSQRLFFDMIRENLTSSNFCNGHTGDRRVEMGLRLKQRVGKSRSSSLSWHFTERPVAVGGVDTSPILLDDATQRSLVCCQPLFFHRCLLRCAASGSIFLAAPDGDGGRQTEGSK